MNFLRKKHSDETNLGPPNEHWWCKYLKKNKNDVMTEPYCHELCDVCWFASYDKRRFVIIWHWTSLRRFRVTLSDKHHIFITKSYWLQQNIIKWNDLTTFSSGVTRNLSQKVIFLVVLVPDITNKNSSIVAGVMVVTCYESFRICLHDFRSVQ
jgi:hypothetical protein